MKNNYWIEFWQDYTANFDNIDEQSQVLRTYKKKPISKELWDFTLKNIDGNFKVNNGDSILDLCSGNGLLSKHFVNKGAEVTAVDISENLLNNLKDINKIKTIVSDIRLLNFEKNSFDSIILYAGIQYLNNKEAIILLKNIYKWLKPSGTVFIGDIPDFSKRWSFFDNAKRQEVYFENILNDKAIVGNWFEKEWFDKLVTYLGYKEGKYLPQNSKLIYSSFRFDYSFIKDVK